MSRVERRGERSATARGIGIRERRRGRARERGGSTRKEEENGAARLRTTARTARLVVGLIELRRIAQERRWGRRMAWWDRLVGDLLEVRVHSSFYTRPGHYLLSTNRDDVTAVVPPEVPVLLFGLDN